MNTGSIVMTPEKASDIALLAPQGKKGQDVGANDLGASFSKVLSEVSDESVTDTNTDKMTENSSQSNDNDAVNMSNLSGALGILPIGIVLPNQQAECNETDKVNLQVQNAEQLSNVNMLTPSTTNKLNGDNLQIPVAAASAITLPLANDVQSLLLTPEEMLQIKTKLEISMNDKSQTNISATIINSKYIQSATETGNAELKVANVAVNSNKITLELGLKVQTEKSSITETSIKTVNDAVTMGLKISEGTTEQLIDVQPLSPTGDAGKVSNAYNDAATMDLSEDIPRVQYSAYGMKIVPGKQDTAEQPMANQPLTKAGDAGKLSNAYVESTIAIDNKVQDKASLSQIKQDVVMQSAATQNVAISAIDDSKQLSQANVEVNNDINSLQMQPIENNSATIFAKANMATESLSKQIGTGKSDTQRYSTDETPKYSQIQLQTSSNGFSIKDTKPSSDQPVADKYAVVSQIVEHAKLINRSNNSEMIIKLQPEHLGELTLKVLVENGVVSTTFHSNNPEVRSVIEASLNQLKQEMSNNGLKVDYVGVYAGLSQFSSQQQKESQQQPIYKFQNKKQITKGFEQAMDVVSQIVPGANIDGIDYRI